MPVMMVTHQESADIRWLRSKAYKECPGSQPAVCRSPTP
ncbi:Uncharacterised protein [Mycobacteroides abscessus subsp. abscessus]|nr:Uncharacterised protein [Mycobacteroides abscessus subsp. abscessus]